MRVLVTGGTGFIASQIIADLLLDGYDVICCARNKKYAEQKFPNAKIVQCDFEKADEAFWNAQLNGVDAVINCAGILSSFSKKKIWKVHFDTPKIIFDTAKKLKIKKIIQVSALGIEENETEFAKSKKAIDDYLISKNIASYIVRPSLVYATGSYGGTALIRALSALPWFIPVPGKGQQRFQPIYIKDVSKSILQLMNSETNIAEVINLVGTEKITLKNILINFRRWLGFGEVNVLSIPSQVISVFSGIFGMLRSPTLNRTSYKMLMCENVATDEQEKKCFEKINFVPRRFQDVLLSNPSYVQDRWHARVYFLRPFLRYSIAFVWIASAVVSFFYPIEKSYAVLSQVGVAKTLQPLFLYGAISLDFLLGFLTLINLKIKLVGSVQCVVILMYSIIVALFLPQYWANPLGPMIKNIPLFAAILVMMSLESSR